MLLGIIICSLIVGLALYDYFSTRNWQVVTSDQRNDAVFENRNKAYGAYQIRRDYNKLVILILFGLTAGVGGLYGASLGIHRHVQKKPSGGFVVGQLDADDEKEDEKPVEKKPVVEHAAEQTQAQTYKFVAPDFKDLQVKDTFSIPDPGKQAGTQYLDGKDPFGDPPNTNTAIIGDSKNDSIPGDENGVPLSITEVAFFKGGREAMIKYLTHAIDPNVEGNGTCKLKFVVAANGTITKVWVKQKVVDCPECDEQAMNAVKNMPAWEPGKLNGTPVNSYFYLPISFR